MFKLFVSHNLWFSIKIFETLIKAFNKQLVIRVQNVKQFKKSVNRIFVCRRFYIVITDGYSDPTCEFEIFATVVHKI